MKLIFNPYVGRIQSINPDIITKTITIPAAQISQLFSTPQQVLPSPGVGKTYEFFDIQGTLNYLTAAYATNTNLYFYFLNNVITVANNTVILTSVNTRKGAILKAGLTGTSINQYPENEPFMVSIGVGNPTGGGGSLTIKITYRIIPV